MIKILNSLDSSLCGEADAENHCEIARNSISEKIRQVAAEGSEAADALKGQSVSEILGLPDPNQAVDDFSRIFANAKKLQSIIEKIKSADDGTSPAPMWSAEIKAAHEALEAAFLATDASLETAAANLRKSAEKLESAAQT